MSKRMSKRMSTRRNKMGKSKFKSTLRRKMNHRRSSVARGLEEECCICDQKIVGKEPLIARECLIKYGRYRAHKICQPCWWSKFAKEDEKHPCPGCVRHIPIPPDPDAGKVIDLTFDDSDEDKGKGRRRK